MNFINKCLRWIIDLFVPEDKKIAALLNLSPDEMRRILPASKVSVFSEIHPIFDYGNKAVKNFVWAIKYRRNREALLRAASYLAEEITTVLEETLPFEGDYGGVVLVPIPMSGKRFREKGFNQCEDLCTLINKQLPNFKYSPVLQKIKETPHQAKLSRAARLKNIKGSFGIKKSSDVGGKLALVIDDVHTTGATFEEAKRVLEKAGAKKVMGFFLAH